MLENANIHNTKEVNLIVKKLIRDVFTIPKYYLEQTKLVIHLRY